MIDAVSSPLVSGAPYAPPPPPPPAPARAEAAAAGVAVRTTKSALIEIVTKDGDRVTISAASVKAASASVATSQAPDGAVEAAATYSAFSSRTLSVSVDGTLDRDEMQDIRQLVSALERGNDWKSRERHGRGHHHGHELGEQRGDDVSRLIDRPSFDSLAGFTATFTASRSYAAVAAYAQASPAPGIAPDGVMTVAPGTPADGAPGTPVAIVA